METNSYELWDAEKGNIIGSFLSAEEGLRVVLVILSADDQRSMNDLLLTCRDGHGAAHVIAQGKPLAELAMRQVTTGAAKATVASKA